MTHLSENTDTVARQLWALVDDLLEQQGLSERDIAAGIGFFLVDVRTSLREGIATWEGAFKLDELAEYLGDEPILKEDP